MERYIRIVRNDFVYNDRTTKLSTYGSIKRLSNHDSGIVSPIYKCFHFNDAENPAFWEWYFESGSHEGQLHGLVNEGARAGRFNISIEKFLSTLAWHPEPSEQQKIADCLSSLNELITAEVQKLNTLTAHKKGLMRQLFPAQGETLPKLRFPEFWNAGEWDKKFIHDLGEIVTGSTPSTTNPKFYGGARLFVSPVDISDQRFIEKTKTTLTELGFSQTRSIKEGSILFVCIGATIGKVAQNMFECATNQQINSITPRENYSNAFVYYTLENSSLQISALAGKHAIPIINKTAFGSFEIALPRLPEQQKIADCLSAIDELITAQTQKLDALKAHKKGLMQQLFPSFDEVQG